MSIVLALWKRGLVVFFRNKSSLVISILIPFFFVYVFSSVFMTNTIENPAVYMMTGVSLIGVFENALAISSGTVDDIVSGFMREVLVSPAKRIYVAVGQLLASATVASFQGVLILFLGIFIGLRCSWVTAVFGVVFMVFIGIVFSGMGLFLATVVKNGQTFQLLRTAIDMPLTFVSGAYLPLALLPTTLRYLAYVNPLTYAVALFRMIMLEKMQLPMAELIRDGFLIKIRQFVVTPTITLLILSFFGLAFILLAAISFAKTDFSKLNRSRDDGSVIWG